MNWFNALKEKPRLNECLLLKTESGDIVTGWLAKLSNDDFYYCFGNEYSSWDYEFNYDLGAVTHFMYQSELPEVKHE